MGKDNFPVGGVSGLWQYCIGMKLNRLKGRAEFIAVRAVAQILTLVKDLPPFVG